jgi:hypothetical protein
MTGYTAVYARRALTTFHDASGAAILAVSLPASGLPVIAVGVQCDKRGTSRWRRASHLRPSRKDWSHVFRLAKCIHNQTRLGLEIKNNLMACRCIRVIASADCLPRPL